MTIFNLKPHETGFDTESLYRTEDLNQKAIELHAGRLWTKVMAEWSNEEIGRLLRSIMWIGQTKMSQSLDLDDFTHLRLAVAAMETAMIWERG